MPDDLTQTTLNLLKNRSAQIMLKQIAAETGLEYEWIKKFHQGEIDGLYKNSQEKIERLNKYLISKLNPTLS